MAVEHEVAIIGAGPYGLSLAAHLGDRNSDFQIFGNPMQLWRDHMPKGMHLKSDGFASNLYDPGGNCTLRRYCQQQGVEYQDVALPVELDTFVKYGLAFKKRFVPDLCSHNVSNVAKTLTGFSLGLESGETIGARKVVVAAGIGHFRYLPPQLESLSTEYVTHSIDHHDLSLFKNRDVVVLGAGASATDIAALLHESGSRVQLVARQQAVRFHSFGGAKPSLFKRLRHPSSGIGPGLRNRFYCDAPGLFRNLPEALRLEIVRRTLGPAGGWFMRDRVIGQIPMVVGFSLESAEVRRDKVYLKLRSPGGDLRELVTEHVVAATGFRSSLERFQFLSVDIRSKLRAVNETPILSRSMEFFNPWSLFHGTDCSPQLRTSDALCVWSTIFGCSGN